MIAAPLCIYCRQTCFYASSVSTRRGHIACAYWLCDCGETTFVVYDDPADMADRSASDTEPSVGVSPSVRCAGAHKTGHSSSTVGARRFRPRALLRNLFRRVRSPSAKITATSPSITQPSSLTSSSMAKRTMDGFADGQEAFARSANV